MGVRKLLCGVALVALLLPADAFAHRIPGVSPMKPGDGFMVGSFRGLMRDPTTKRYQRAPILLDQLRDGPWTFLSMDPNTSRDIEEAKRFEAALKSLHNTHGMLVIPPAQSMLIDHMAELMTKTTLQLPVVLDDRDVFPYAFRHELNATPRYEVLDRSQTLVIQNASALAQKSPDGETLAELIKRIDHGETVAPWVVSIVDQVINDPRE